MHIWEHSQFTSCGKWRNSLFKALVSEEYTSAPLHLVPEPWSEFRSALYMKHDVANFSTLSRGGNKRRTLFIMTSWLSRIKQTWRSRRDPVVPFTAQIQYWLIFPPVRLRDIPYFTKNLAVVVVFWCIPHKSNISPPDGWEFLGGVSNPKQTWAQIPGEMAESAFSLGGRAIVYRCCHTLLMLV